MKQLPTIIVDDEKESRSLLRTYLSRYCPDITVVAEAASVQEAVQQISVHDPGLVFLDIDMPFENGFALFGKIPSPSFYTVFVTAYDTYALEAIKKHALDYILKPVNIDELIRTVEHVKTLVADKAALTDIRLLQQTILKMRKQEKIALPVLEGYAFVNIDEIVRCEAEINYTRFYFANGTKMLICQTLGNYEQLLKAHGFIRVHHRHLINISYVEKYLRGRGGTVIMKNNTEVVVSQRKKDEFLKLMEQYHII